MQYSKPTETERAAGGVLDDATWRGKRLVRRTVLAVLLLAAAFGLLTVVLIEAAKMSQANLGPVEFYSERWTP